MEHGDTELRKSHEMSPHARRAEESRTGHRGRLSRRRFVKLTASILAAALLGACASEQTLGADGASDAPAPDLDPEAGSGGEATAGGTEHTADPQSWVVGTGPTEIEVWYQDWEGTDQMMRRVGESYADEHDGVSIDLRPIPYADLFTGLLPAIAAGDEGDIVMMYTNWLAGSDIRRALLDITEPMGGFARATEMFWDASLAVLDAPEQRVFYLPWLGGMRGATLTVNRDHVAEQGLDLLDFRTWEEVVEAGKVLTQRSDAGALTRAGYAINASQCCLLYNIIWGLGGSMYDRATGRWSWHSDEGVEAVRRLYEVYWTHETSSHDLYPSEFRGASDGLISIWGEGAWTASIQDRTAGVPADNVVMPRIADAVTDDLYPDHIAGWGLSRRLADAEDRLGTAIGFALAIVGPDATLPLFEEQSSVCASKDVYADPRIEGARYGVMSHRVASGVWPRARYNGDHVVEMGPAYDTLARALRNEISAEEALRSMDAYCQEQEDEARERIGS